MRKWLYGGLFVVCIVLGYFLRGAIGRERIIWLVVGLLGLMVVVALAQIGARHYVRSQEARMSPAERREFEEFKKRHSKVDKTS
jgi:hypothetical protein